MNHYAMSLLVACSVLTPLEAKVYLWAHNKQQSTDIREHLEKFNIKYEAVDRLQKEDDQNLYIVCDLLAAKQEELPHYYIAYLGSDLNQSDLTPDYIQKLTNAIAIWDSSWNNINKYRHQVHNYLYMPHNYEHADPVILPCSLPVSTLSTYKELLCYSNKKDTDISSHLPAIFCHTFLQKPEIIVEAGIRGGESTKPLYNAAQLCKSSLIGVDIDPAWARSTYNDMNALCLEMNDLDFGTYYLASPYKDKKIDLIFIDTSHEYKHTLQEITVFVPLLGDNGALMFHDSNVTPLERSGYIRLNGSWDGAPGNPRGVPQAIKEYFELEFNEYTYCNTIFIRNGTTWHMIHYPFCNGLTVIRKIGNS